MTLKQLISPAVIEWIKKNKHIPKEQRIVEFRKWIADNKEVINESVNNNIDKINEHIERGCKKSQLLMEGRDWSSVSLDDDDDDTDDEPITGKDDTEEKASTIFSKIEDGEILVLTNKKSADPEDPDNIFDVVNIVYDVLEEDGISNEDNAEIWSMFDVSNIKKMTALFAFTDIRDADLSSWDVSNVENMEGMFYKSTFNNDSICSWKVGSCENFKRMFAYSNFNQILEGKWKTKKVLKPILDKDGKPVKGADGEPLMKEERIPLPLIGANNDEETAMLKRKWSDRIKNRKTKKEITESTTMKHILDYDTFINEGFKDFIKKGFDKVKSFFKNMAVKFNNFVAMFDENGEIIDASSPYTALNYISDGKVKGVTAFTGVKNEYLNDNVKSIASIVESPEYYGIIDKNSIEYRNYLTMVDMVNEHYSKYGNKLNENESIDDAPRIGFSSEGAGLYDAEDISTKTLKFYLKQAILNVPAYKDEDASGAMLIWGAPGIGKSTIPKAIINEWNDNHDINEKKAIMVVECGNLTVDGFSLPIPMTKTMGEYLQERPEVLDNLKAKGYDVDEDFLKKEISVAAEALKTWLPCYKDSVDERENEARNDIANGHIVRKHVGGRHRVTKTTEGGILLFDEFFRANESIFKILMQIVLNRSFNDEYVLGDKWAIIACSNRPGDDKEVRNGIKSTGGVVGTRWGAGQFNFIPNFDEWKKWAVDKGHFDGITLAFLTQKIDPETKEYTNWHTIRPLGYNAGKTAWPTPRSWSMLMADLHNIMENEGCKSLKELPEEIIRSKAAGQIGKKMAQEYVDFITKYKSNFDPEKVLNSPKYNILSSGATCMEATEKLKDYIRANFSEENLPSDEQMMNMFNALTDNFGSANKQLQKGLYFTTLYILGFIENNNNVEKYATKLFPNFIDAVMELYKLNPADLIKEVKRVKNIV